MKKLLAILMAVIIIMAFAGCSSKQYEDTEVTIPVTDENGETVTDEKGNAVTEVSTEAASNNKSDNSNTTENQSKKNTTTTNKNGGSASTKEKTSANKNNTAAASKPNSTEKKETTTAKPVKRNIDLTVVVPYFNQAKDTKITVKYRVEGKKYKELVNEDITLGSEQTKKYTIKKVKGDVDVVVTIDGVDVTYNTLKIMSYEKSGTIKLVTGIEMLDGGWD